MGGDAYTGLVWPPGSKETFLGDIRPIEMGSDHAVFEEASFAVPMVYFHDWPDVTIHTNKDQPENLDATKLGRVAYLGAGIAWTLAALPDAEAPKLLVLAAVEAGERVLRARASGTDAAVVENRQLDAGLRTLASVASLWNIPAGDLRREEDRLRRLATPASDAASHAPRDGRVPVRNAEIRGPLEVYYFNFLKASGAAPTKSPALAGREKGDVLTYEAFNLVDGRRTVSDIRDALSGLYAPVPLAEVAEYLDSLAAAGAVHFGR
jgi:hypothetical protein